ECARERRSSIFREARRRRRSLRGWRSRATERPAAFATCREFSRALRSSLHEPHVIIGELAVVAELDVEALLGHAEIDDALVPTFPRREIENGNLASVDDRMDLRRFF